MKVMVVGGGGREHAIIKKLKENKSITSLYALPGNGGIAADAECVAVDAKNIDGLVAFAKEKKIDFAVVAPDDPLVLGAVDALEAVGVPCFGPNQRAAVIEGSKVFSKNLMKKYGIPTAAYEVFTDVEAALQYMQTAPVPAVIKADGLALGKGVIIAMTRQEALDGIRRIMSDRIFGDSGAQIVIEEYLTGPEVSVLAFTDGHVVLPMVSSMDHKRAQDGDRGLNTGGMGTVAPNPYYTEQVADVCMRTIFEPTIAAMREEGRPFKGCLYFGLMLTADGPKVIEYNCRFGDPEAQVVLPLLQSDLFEIMQSVRNGTLRKEQVVFSQGAACCVIMAAEGYPVAYEKGRAIHIPEEIVPYVCVAGAARQAGTLVSAGGRVLGVTAVADQLQDAVSLAYERVGQIEFDGSFYRKDIGAKALAAGQ